MKQVFIPGISTPEDKVTEIGKVATDVIGSDRIELFIAYQLNSSVAILSGQRIEVCPKTVKNLLSEFNNRRDPRDYLCFDDHAAPKIKLMTMNHGTEYGQKALYPPGCR